MAIHGWAATKSTAACRFLIEKSRLPGPELQAEAPPSFLDN